MKEIDPKFIKIQHPGKPVPGPSSKKQSPSGKGVFESLLKDQINKDPAKTTGKQELTLPELSATFKSQQLGVAFDKSDFTKRFETSLKLLESYAAWLSDPEKSLKQTRSILEQLIFQTQTLDQTFASHAAGNPELAELLSQLKATVQVEQIKFDRGDYLTQ